MEENIFLICANGKIKSGVSIFRHESSKQISPPVWNSSFDPVIYVCLADTEARNNKILLNTNNYQQENVRFSE